jgi:hypothetical protein
MEQVAKFPGLGRAELMERYKEAIPYAKNPEEAKQLLPIIAQTMAALKLMGRPIEGMGFMIKAAQNVGMTKDPARFKGLMEAYVRYVNIKGPEFTPEMMASFFAGMKGSSAMLSDRFMHTIAMSLAAEMGSGKAGAGVDQLVKTAIAPTSEQAKEFVPLGLMNQSDFERPTAHGSFKSFGHVRAGAVGKLKSGAHVAGWQLAQTDPAEWIKRYFVPAMIQHGITDLESQLALVQKIYPGRSADVVTKLITQGEEYENEAKRAAKAAGTEETIKDYQSDATAQLDVLGTSLSNFGAVTKEIMPAAALAMDQISRSIASWSKSLSEWTEKHPTAAPWVVGSGIVAGLGASLAGTAYGAVKAIRFIKGLSGGVAAGEGAAASAAAPAGGLTAAGAKLLPAVSPTLLGAQQIIAAGTAGLNNPQLNAAIQHALPAYARGDQADSFGNGGGASGSWSNNTSAYRIPSPTGSPFDSRQAPIYIPPMIDTGSSDAHAAGARFAEAFREGVFGPLTGAVDDVLKARAAMLAALTFGASPSIKPTGGDIWTSGTTGINANGTFSDMGIAPLR